VLPALVSKTTRGSSEQQSMDEGRVAAVADGVVEPVVTAIAARDVYRRESSQVRGPKPCGPPARLPSQRRVVVTFPPEVTATLVVLRRAARLHAETDGPRDWVGPPCHALQERERAAHREYAREFESATGKGC